MTEFSDCECDVLNAGWTVRRRSEIQSVCKVRRLAIANCPDPIMNRLAELRILDRLEVAERVIPRVFHLCQLVCKRDIGVDGGKAFWLLRPHVAWPLLRQR